MRPDAHIAAAIEILDDILAGTAAERCLTTWARRHRFAGSSDRAAIRDIVFDALRRRRSYGWLGGSESGRGLMIGRQIHVGTPVDAVFTGLGHAPPPLAPHEAAAARTTLDGAPRAVALDCPDWLWPGISADLGESAASVLALLRDRAPVFLRVNRARTDRAGAIRSLARDGIDAEPHSLAESALVITANERRLRGGQAYREGWVELQDAASQAVVERCLANFPGGRVLDYCAGGGGKALAFAGTGAGDVTAHDASPRRMKDIPARAERAGTPIKIVEKVDGPFDFVLCDAPCSGSGAWRRQPEGKWRFDPARLSDLNRTQDSILDTAMSHVGDRGHLAYATCSILSRENDARAEAFLARHPDWTLVERRAWSLLDGADGFFLAIFRKS